MIRKLVLAGLLLTSLPVQAEEQEVPEEDELARMLQVDAAPLSAAGRAHQALTSPVLAEETVLSPVTLPPVTIVEENSRDSAPRALVNVPILNALGKEENARVSFGRLGEMGILPDFTNNAAWLNAKTNYNTPYLWGQCTWFAWGRFYEIYGFDPGFTGDGWMCVYQLVAKHPDLFEKSSHPVAGSVFSSDLAHNHVGLILAVQEGKRSDHMDDLYLVQEGNFDGISNSNWTEAIGDWETRVMTRQELHNAYGNVVYANPILEDENGLMPEPFLKRRLEIKEDTVEALPEFKFGGQSETLTYAVETIAEKQE